MASVLLPWVQGVSWKCQSILQGGFRGPDIGNVPHIKAVNRWLRRVSQNNADPTKQYMRDEEMPSELELCEELEFCPCHYTHHLADALRVVAIWNPEEEVRARAFGYHYRIAEEIFHFLPEDTETFVKRHVDKT